MWYLLAGIAFGVIGGMGMGGGVILIPILTGLLSAGQHTAQGLNLLCFLPTSIFALFLHLKKKQVEVKTALLLAAGGLAGAVGGAFLADHLQNDMLRKLFGAALLTLGGSRLIRLAKQRKNVYDKKK